MRASEVGIEEFEERAATLLRADEARNNLALGLLTTFRAAPDLYPGQRFWLAERAGTVTGAALVTPPFNLVLPRPLDVDALSALAAAIDVELPGVTAALPECTEFAELWCGPRRLEHEVRIAQGIYALERVIPARGAAGAHRRATLADEELVVRWFRAFGAEAHHGSNPHGGNPEADARAARAVAARLGDDLDAGVELWEHAGEIVSLAAFGGETPNGIRIGPVYTPPEHRGHGYATALTAALSAQLLSRGRTFCFLYTDLANPTSNRIYRAIGYEQVCESAEIAFVG